MSNKKVSAFKKQSMECYNCGKKVKTSVILDQKTSKAYFICPNCEYANKK